MVLMDTSIRTVSPLPPLSRFVFTFIIQLFSANTVPCENTRYVGNCFFNFQSFWAIILRVCSVRFFVLHSYRFRYLSVAKTSQIPLYELLLTNSMRCLKLIIIFRNLTMSPQLWAIKISTSWKLCYLSFFWSSPTRSLITVRVLWFRGWETEVVNSLCVWRNWVFAVCINTVGS